MTPDLLLARLQHRVDAARDLRLVGLNHRRQDRRRHVIDAARAQQRSNVLRQARPAEGEARLEIGGRNVELLVLAKHAHHILRVGAQRIAQVRDLVGEGDLQRMECIADVLDHLGRAYRSLQERRADPGIQLPERVARVGIVAADEHERRVIEVFDRRAFAHELGVDGDADRLGHAAAIGTLGQHARKHPLGRSRQDGAAQHDRQRTVRATRTPSRSPVATRARPS